jgi:hypothetical protein
MWEITERVDAKGKLVKTYVRKKKTDDQAINNIEEMFEGRLSYAAEKSSHKQSYGRDISDRIDQTFALVRDFLTRNESEEHKAKRLKEEAKRREEEVKRREEEAKRLADAAKRRAEDEKAQELRRQRIAEHARAEAADVEVKEGWSEVRVKLAGDLGTMCKTYEGLVSRFGDAMRRAMHPHSSRYIHDGYILDALQELSTYMAGRPFKKTEDTVQCCLFLLNCTKYLACDGKYKRAGHLSKDERFTAVYQGKYEFRRNWVALLRQIVGYVEMLYEGEEDDKKLYLNRLQLEKLQGSNYMWDGYGKFWPRYVWSTITQQIETAEEAIKKEPEPKKTGWQRLKNSVSRKGEELQGEDVPELLARLQELGWCVDEDLKTEV